MDKKELQQLRSMMVPACNLLEEMTNTAVTYDTSEDERHHHHVTVYFNNKELPIDIEGDSPQMAVFDVLHAAKKFVL